MRTNLVHALFAVTLASAVSLAQASAEETVTLGFAAFADPELGQAIIRAADDVAAVGWDAEAGFGRANANWAVDNAINTASPTATFLSTMHEESLYGDVAMIGNVGPPGTTPTPSV